MKYTQHDIHYDLHYLQAYTDTYRPATQEDVNILLHKLSQLNTKRHEDIQLVTLPPPVQRLPCNKKQTVKSRWQLFAERKGIRKRKCREVYDEVNDTFLPRYGRFGINKRKGLPREE